MKTVIKTVIITWAIVGVLFCANQIAARADVDYKQQNAVTICARLHESPSTKTINDAVSYLVAHGWPTQDVTNTIVASNGICPNYNSLFVAWAQSKPWLGDYDHNSGENPLFSVDGKTGLEQYNVLV